MPKKGEDLGEEREWAIAPPNSSLRSPEYIWRKRRKKDISFLFFLSLFLGRGRKECNRWRRSDPPHPPIPQPHFLNHPPQKNPQGMGFVYMNVQELILRHNISPKRRKIVLFYIQIFVREGGTSGKNDAEKKGKEGIVRKEKRGTFPRLLREDECCSGSN